MIYNPDIHHRRSIRLKKYDYSLSGSYYVTICIQGHVCLLGDVVDGEMKVSKAGQLVRMAWDDLPNHYSYVELNDFVIMPNHIHGVISLVSVGAGLKPAPTKTSTKRHGLSEIVRAFKTFSARQINQSRKTPGFSIWQRNYYEHVIRNRADYKRIAEYIACNPQKWEEDSLHPSVTQRSHGDDIEKIIPSVS